MAAIRRSSQPQGKYMNEDQVSPDMQRRNLTLGLALGGFCLAQVIAYMILFKTNGLPKDPKVWHEQQARQSASQGTP